MSRRRRPATSRPSIRRNRNYNEPSPFERLRAEWKENPPALPTDRAQAIGELQELVPQLKELTAKYSESLASWKPISDKMHSFVGRYGNPDYTECPTDADLFATINPDATGAREVNETRAAYNEATEKHQAILCACLPVAERLKQLTAFVGEIRAEELRKAHANFHAKAAKALKPFAVDESEAGEIAGALAKVAAAYRRIGHWNGIAGNWLQNPLWTASALLQDLETPLPA